MRPVVDYLTNMALASRCTDVTRRPLLDPHSKARPPPGSVRYVAFMSRGPGATCQRVRGHEAAGKLMPRIVR